MDLNIGTAFWFASRGKGYLRTYTQAELTALLDAATCTEANEEEGETATGTLTTVTYERERHRSYRCDLL
jgi:hypothetical protein